LDPTDFPVGLAEEHRNGDPESAKAVLQVRPY
jgi:hypothetical protein